VLDFRLRLQEGDVKGHANGCVLSSPLVLVYALMAATAGGANRIMLAGLDGYDASDPGSRRWSGCWSAILTWMGICLSWP